MSRAEEGEFETLKFVSRQLFCRTTSAEEADQLDSGMGSSDAHSPEVKSLLPDDEEEDDDEEVRCTSTYDRALIDVWSVFRTRAWRKDCWV